MTKNRNFTAFVLMTITLLLAACGSEDYKQIYLYDTENRTRITDGSELNLYCYREHSYIVRGGSGTYEIECLEGGNISATWGKKDTLKLLANFPINASIRISDNMTNSTTLNINVDYLNKRYSVDSIHTEVKGDYLKVIEMQEVQEKIRHATELAKGCTFIFIYDNENDIHQGQLRITDNKSNPIISTMKFKEEEEVKIEGETIRSYQPIHAYADGRTAHEYVLIKEMTADNRITSIKIREDVKEGFRNEPYYANLEAANVYYDVTEIVNK